MRAREARKNRLRAIFAVSMNVSVGNILLAAIIMFVCRLKRMYNVRLQFIHNSL